MTDPTSARIPGSGQAPAPATTPLPEAMSLLAETNPDPRPDPSPTPGPASVAAPVAAPGMAGAAAASAGGVPALQIMGLTKVFGQKVAVDRLTLTVPAGCMFGLVGPNGAGKTTTLSMCTGLLRPDAGAVQVWGHDVWTDPAVAKAGFGVLPDGLRTFDRLSGRELIEVNAGLRGIPRDVARQRADALLQVLGLADDASKMVADYSAGMTKKIGLACALVHNPRLLILDEPLEAVDPVSGQVIRDLLRGFVANGGTVVLSSHVMELVETLCDAVGVVNQGRVVAAGWTRDVTAGMPLQERFIQLVGGRRGMDSEGLQWLGH